MPKKIIIVRHGETEHNKKKIAQGWLDTELSEVGLIQARKLARRLEKEKIDEVYTSDLKRAFSTTEELRKRLGIRPKVTKLLRERNMGVFQGLSWDEITGRMGDLYDEFRNTKDDDWKGHKGESRREAYERPKELLKKVGKKHKNKTVLLSTHGGTKRKLLRLLGVLKTKKPIHLENTSVTIVEKSKDGSYEMTVFNDASHLGEDES